MNSLRSLFLVAACCCSALIASNLASAQYTLTVESSPAITAGLTTYRFYVDMQDPTDRMSAVFGNDQASLLVNTPGGAAARTFLAASILGPLPGVPLRSALHRSFAAQPVPLCVAPDRVYLGV